jgi:hypothetical protein
LFISQLARKHPVPFFQFLDICARSGQQHDADKSRYLVRLVTHGCAKVGTKGLAELLSSSAATAALASALCSALKLWPASVIHSSEQPAAAAAADGEQLTRGAAVAAGFLHGLCKALSLAMQHVIDEAVAGRSSSSSVQQALTSAVLLVVLVSRCLLKLAEAVGDAGGSDQPFLACAAAAFAKAHIILRLLYMRVDLAAAQKAGTIAGDSSSSSRPVRWQYLLRLLESRKLCRAFAAYQTEWGAAAITALLEHIACEVVTGTASSSAAQQQHTPDDNSGEQRLHLQQLYADTLAFCKTLTAVAPLPVVCNNRRCSELSGVSEAAAARYVCAGCGCRYCSAACQAASWRGHKKACRRMAACGMRVED